MKSKSIFKWIIYGLILLFVYILQTTPYMFEIAGTKPMFIIAFVMVLAVFEGELAGCVFAITAGLLWDSSFARLAGFSSIILMVLCVTAALLTMYLIRVNLVNSIIICTASTLIYQMVYYFFYFWIWGYEENGILFRGFLYSVVYTAAISPAFYYTIKKLRSVFSPNDDNSVISD